MEFGIFHEFWSTTAQSQAEAFRNSFAEIEAAERWVSMSCGSPKST